MRFDKINVIRPTFKFLVDSSHNHISLYKYIATRYNTDILILHWNVIDESIGVA